MKVTMIQWLVLMAYMASTLYAHYGEGNSSEAEPVPATWPEQFHSVLYINNSGSLQVTDLWYDWPNGRNFNIIQKQLGRKLYDLEWNNGTSFYYYLDKNECKRTHFEVGILRPNWLEGAHYVGVQSVDGFLCNVWEKVDFIHYYEDTVTKRPVHWLFYTGMSAHVVTFEVGAVLEDSHWQAPIYCFEGEGAKSQKYHLKKDESHLGEVLAGFQLRSLFQ